MALKISLFTHILFLILISNVLSDVPKKQKCIVDNCIVCSVDGKKCNYCSSEYLIFNNKCYDKCKKIKNCEICDENAKNCLQCEKNCKVSNSNMCDCTQKNIIINSMIILTTLMIIVLYFCLSYPSLARRFYISQSLIFHGKVTDDKYNYALTYDKQIQKDEVDLVGDFLKYMVILNENVSRKKCECCRTYICNMKLDCGCYICNNCEKNIYKNNGNVCINCQKKYELKIPVTCFLCKNKQKELASLNCYCNKYACQNCYISFRLKNRKCPKCGIVFE